MWHNDQCYVQDNETKRQINALVYSTYQNIKK